MTKDITKANLIWLFKDPCQFWIFLAIISIHWATIGFFRLDIESVNSYFGPFLQIIGGLIVLYIINGNIELFRHINLFQVFVNWIKSRPSIKPYSPINGKASLDSQGAYLRAVGIVWRKCNTLEELQDEMQKHYEEIMKLISENEKTLINRITFIESTLKSLIDENRKDIQSVKQLTFDSAIGSFKWELLGVALIIYGAIITIF